MPQLSPMLSRLEESPISKMFVRAAKLRAEGRSIIDVTFGEPDFSTPDHAANAGIEAIRRGDTKYTANSGTKQLLESIQRKFKRDYGLDFDLNRVCSGAGAKGFLFNVLQAILYEGAEAIIPTPAYPSFEGMTNVLGAIPVKVFCSEADGFKLSPQALRDAISPATRVLFVNSPGNPTGAVYSDTELRALADVLVDHPNIWIVSDDVYESLMHDGAQFSNMAIVAPELLDRVVILNGISKGYAMTGWRVGYIAAAPELIRAVEIIVSQTSSAAPTMSQAAAIAALDGPQDYLVERADTFQRRRDLALAAIADIPDLTLAKPAGGMFAFVGFEAALGKTFENESKLQNSTDFALHLLDSVGLAVVPGTAFSAGPFIRISLGVSDETLLDAFQRLGKAMAHISRK